jgi:CheY-like chemotaxis protein
MRDLLGSLRRTSTSSSPHGRAGIELARAPARPHPHGHQPAGDERPRRAARAPRGEQAGFFRYLTKPVRVAELEQVLETLLDMSPPGSATPPPPG